MGRQADGFTLIEIAVVLVIIGLLLGGVLKGQELIASARVRNLISQQEGAKSAFYGFQDRYRGLPGDYAAASSNIKCTPNPCINGNGNGLIEPPNASGVYENILVWTHLSASGFILGSYNVADETVGEPSDADTPKNPFGSYIGLAYDSNWGLPGNTIKRHHLKTGSNVPVEIAAEVDRKIDDGFPYSGSFQFSAFAPGSTTPNPATCVQGSSNTAIWAVTNNDQNCGGTSLL